MTDPIKTLSRQITGRAAYRRHHTKSDGRDLFLYGYKPHDLPRVEGEDLQSVTGAELRYHPLRGDWSIYAAGRQNRTFKPSAAANPLAPSQSGKPLTEIPFEDYELAVFANRFPSLSADAEEP
ncbi:MAG: galactose-1-phosphate uridylyltransferase, partial [Pseudomonadota bacterium]